MQTRRLTSFRLPAVPALLALAALLLFAAPTAVQAQRAGYIAENDVLARMSEVQQARQQIQSRLETQIQSQYGNQQAQLQRRQQEFQQAVQQFQSQSEMLSEDSRAQRRQELQQQQMALQEDAQQMQRSIAQEERALQEELLRPVIQQYEDAVTAVAQERNLDFVIRREALVYMGDDAMVDITEAVASRLNVNLQQPATGTVPSVGSSGR